LLTSAFAQKDALRPFTVDDDLNMVLIGDVLISPDGKQVFYSKSELDWDKNKRKLTYYMVSAEGGTPQQYIGEAEGSSFQFSPDGSRILYFEELKWMQKYVRGIDWEPWKRK
jgi:dipeptidyl aminopeptidase/acylaminoacyl peptidase